MIPLLDASHQKGKIPLLTILLIFLNTFFFFFSLPNLNYFVEKFGFFPEKFLKNQDIFSIFSSMFLHGSFFHLISNMWFLWLFGDNVEFKLKKIRFLILYFGSGIGAAFFHSFLTSQKSIPTIGASGAISGILGAYLLLFPKNKILTLVPFFYFYRIMFLPAFLFIGIWFLGQFLYMNYNPFVAWWAHIGGFLTGLLITHFLKKK